MKLEFEKPKSFYFHYNKPASAKAGEPRMSVHVNNTCYIVPVVHCQVGCKTKINKRQPRVVMAGKCSSIIIQDSSITVN